MELKNDNIPEPQEVYDIRLTGVSTEDGVGGTTNSSGASIDPNHMNSTVIMNENDFLNGLLQFKADGIPPLSDDPYIEPLLEQPTVSLIHVLNSKPLY